MTRKNKKPEERKVRASDFAMYQTTESRPTGLHCIFDAFHKDLSSHTSVDAAPTGRSDGASSAYLELSSEILKALDKLTKKDGTTKLKALENLEALLDTTPDYVVESILPDFMHVFKRLAVVEPLRKVRLSLGKVLCKIAGVLKRKMQSQMDAMVAHWFLAMHDAAPDVAAAYVEAFDSLFTTTLATRQERDRKTFRVLTHYIQTIAGTYKYILSRDINSYKSDWLDVFGKACDNCATVSDMHNRLMCSVLQALEDLMVYQRQYGTDVCPYSIPVSVFLNSEFVAKLGSLCRSSSFKQRLATVRLMVEVVKVLRDDHLPLAKDIFKIGMQRLYANEEAPIINQHIRVICACARYNSICWEPVVLDNYASLLNGIMDRYNGDFAATIELYSLFPCMVSYLPREWLRSPAGVAAVLEVTSHLLQLMCERINKNYESSFAFDSKLFGQVGSSMLYCYYRVLLLLENSCDTLVRHALLPIMQLQSNYKATTHYFVAQLPRIFTEFVEESMILRSPEASEAFFSSLRDLHNNQTNYIFMARVFARLGEEPQDGHARHVQLRSYARDVQAQLRAHIMNYELPPLLLEYLEDPSSEMCLKKVDDMLSVLEDVKLQSIAPDSRIVELPRFLMLQKYAQAWEFEKAFSTLSRALVLFKPLLEAPSKYFDANTDAASLLLVSLLALLRCGSEDDAVRISRIIFETSFSLSEGNAGTVLLKFIQVSQRFAPVLSHLVLSWLMQPSHVTNATSNAVYDAVDPRYLDKEALVSYELLYVALHLTQRAPSKRYTIEHQPLVEDLASLFLVGYYMNLPVDMEILLNFSLDLLPFWKNGQSCADSQRLTSFLRVLQEREDLIHNHTNAATDEIYATKDVVYAMLAMQGSPCETTKAISRTLSALTALPRIDTTSIFCRNAGLFSQIWLMNCETYLPMAVSTTCKEESDQQLREVSNVMSKCKQGNTLQTTTEAISSKDDPVTCFAGVFVTTLAYSGFTCPLFVKLLDKLVDLGLCTGVITDMLVRHFQASDWNLRSEYESTLNLFAAFLAKSATNANTMADLFKRQYTSNPFMGGFLAAINRVRNVPVTELDNLLLLLESCGEADVASLTNCISEITQVLEDAVGVSEGVYSLKCMADLSYLNTILDKVILAVFGRLSVLGPCDATSTRWLHHALIGFFRSCFNVVKALSVDAWPFLNVVGNVWFMRGVNFCYWHMAEPSHAMIELLAHIIQFGISQQLFSLDNAKVRPAAYDYSHDSAMEYTEVIEALSNDNLSRVLAAGSMEETLETMDAHYVLTMVVHMLERADNYFASLDSEACSIQSSRDSLKVAAYEFLSLCSQSRLAYPYSLAVISRLWRCAFLFSDIAEYSGALCMVNLEHNNVFFTLPAKFVSSVIDTPTKQANIPKAVPVDISQMLFNLLQDPEVAEDEAEEPVETPKSHTTQVDKLLGTKAIDFYLKLILGPHLTDSLFKIYDVFMVSGDHKDLEPCLIAWLSAFVLLQKLKESNQLTMVNSLEKLLTMKPADAGGALYETLQSMLIDATAVDGREYVDAWWLEAGTTNPGNTEDSALHVLLQVLVLCLENLEEDKRHRKLIKTLYYRVSKTFPEEVNHVWNRCKNAHIKKRIVQFTKSEITQRLIADELEMLKLSKSSALHISHNTDNRTLYVSLDTKAEVSIKLTIKIPATFPLEPLSFASSDDAGTFKNKHLRWLMMAQSTANRSGISQGLLLWNENITNFFNGIEECPICYSIVHLQFNTIPGKTCKVCKHKFHTECLYK